MNSNNLYTESGCKAGKAAKNGDWSMVTFQKNWLNRALSIEDPENRHKLRQVWENAYKSEHVTKSFRGYWN